MRRGITHTVSVAGVLIAVLVLISGCDNTIVPFSETTRHFAIYGFLDAAADTQFVRIEPTRSLLDESSNVAEISSVTTTELSSGNVTVWSESSVKLEDGRTAVAYWAAFRPVPNATYRIDVTGSDGPSSWATTTVPYRGSIEPLAPTRTRTGTLEQQIILGNVDHRPEAITMNYDVTIPPSEKLVRITLDYNVYGARTEAGWRIDVRLTRDREQILSRLSLPPEHTLYLYKVSMTVRLVSSDWPPIGSDEGVNNVVDGFGFFGSASTDSFDWRVDSLTVKELGFEDKQGDPPAGDGE